MTRIGITGHQNIPIHALQRIEEGIRSALADMSTPLEGYSSLAEGADQLFASVILTLGGRLHAVIPSSNYESTFDGPALAQYRNLLIAATDIEQLPFDEPEEGAYEAAGHTVINYSDVLLAVWDGEPARGRGGTADAVRYAQAKQIPVIVVWPAGVTR